MKYTWELSDIQVGIRLKNKKNIENPEFIIGYRYSKSPEEGVIICLIHLCDGFILKESADKKDIVRHLNRYDYIPAKIEN